MSLLRNITSGLRSLFRKDQVDRELNEELGAYLEMEAAEKMKQGMSRRDALRAVRLERGGLELAKEVVRSGSWESFVETCWQDVRFGLRNLRKNPGFTVVAVLTLTLGIGATSALFSMVEAVLLKPLPYQQSSRLAILWTDNVRQNLHQERTSYPNFEDWRKQNSIFEDMAFASAFTVNLTGGEEPERLLAGRTSANLFSLMGVRPILGRIFSSEEERHADRVIVVSHRLWQGSFGSSQDILGKTLEVDGTKMEIVGVMPAAFEFPARNVELWAPLTVFPNWNRSEEHTSELQSLTNLVCRLLLEKKKNKHQHSREEKEGETKGKEEEGKKPTQQKHTRQRNQEENGLQRATALRGTQIGSTRLPTP